MAPSTATAGARSLPPRWRWLAALTIPAAILVASFAMAPVFYEATIVTREVPADETAPVGLFTTANRQVFFTTRDLLHPETFDVEAARIDAVLVDVPARFPGATESSAVSDSWRHQILKLLLLQTAEGAPRPGATAAAADRAMADRFLAFWDEREGPGQGRAVLFPVDPGTTVARESGLRAIVLVGVAAPPGAPSGGTAGDLAPALREAGLLLAEAGLGRAGVACIGTLAGTRACEAPDWALLLDALPDATLSTVVLGGWGMSAETRVGKARELGRAWAVWQRDELSAKSRRIADEALRLAALALVGALVMLAVRGAGFSWIRLLAIVVLAGGATGAAAKLAGAYLELWNGLSLPRPADLAIKAGVAIAIGVLLPAIAQFKPGDIVAGDMEGTADGGSSSKT